MAACVEDLPLSPPASPDVIEELLQAFDEPSDDDQVNVSIPAHLFAAGWRRHRSPNSGRYFYFNLLSQESRWTLPLIEEPTRQQQQPLQQPQHQQQQQQRQPQLQPAPTGVGASIRECTTTTNTTTNCRETQLSSSRR